MGWKRNLWRVLAEKPEGKRPLLRLRRMGKYNIKIFLREIGWGGMDLINLAQDWD
jgi:hypothetical protein